jgi:uncharacterized protein YyaL (SSP411 family)
MHKHSNHLIHETSPYLLQHAHNPVNWYPWGEEALRRAKEENKPILVSIGYSACHWCHVMERESFEDDSTAEIMNEHFVNIKIDREERPDLDHIYMDAVQAMTGSGGWPLNVFLTPDCKPFYGGTYFPPKRAFNRNSWKEILASIIQLFKQRRSEIDIQAENLIAHLLQSNSFGLQNLTDPSKALSQEKIEEAFKNIMTSADKEWGGFGTAPKFPQTFMIQFLLRYHYVTKNEEALGQSLLSLDKMIEGGIYDQVGGGFARYSTDTEWLAPHFEKMLYDNALLISVLSEAYQLTKEQEYKKIIDESMGFICRELLHPQKGFYSALDADSEGEEGKFYVWNIEEVTEIVGSDGVIFCQYFDVTKEGNWEEKNILRIKTPLEKFAKERNISPEKLKEVIQRGKEKLLEKRNSRVRPLLDDKIILGWNALMNTACSKAFMATGNNDYRQLAVDNMQFLFEKFCIHNSNEFSHVWKNDIQKYPAFLDDYAFLIQALILLQEITADTNWLLRAEQITKFVIEHFSEEGTGFFYYTSIGQSDVILRKKELYDGAVPSGNSVMAYNLYQLSIYFDKKDWKETAIKLVSSLAEVFPSHPTSFGIWCCLFLEMINGTNEIAILGKNFSKLQKDLFDQYLPHRILMSSNSEKNEFPLLAGKKTSEIPLIYLCKEFACQQPVTSIDRFMSLINRL